MDDTKPEQFAENLLDAALAYYQHVESRPDLEERVLASLRAERRPRAWCGWNWRLAATVAAVTLLAATAHWMPRRPARLSGPRPVTAVADTRTPAPVPAPAFNSRQSALPHLPGGTGLRDIRKAASRRTEPEPRMSVFPSPAPLSAQEKLLVRYVRENPAPVLIALHTPEQPIEDLQIKDLEVPPLEAEAADTKTEKNQ